MDDILDIDIILLRKKYPRIYNLGIISVIILLIFIYVSCTYTYQTYYYSYGIAIERELKVSVSNNDLKYFKNDENIELDDNEYSYKLLRIEQDISNKDYSSVYLKINNLPKISNYIYQVRILKDNKKLIEYLKEYL